MQSRYYDAVTGRFINADVMLGVGTNIGSYNMFAYCNNNPISRSDSTGQWFGMDDLIAGAVGAVVGVASQFVSDVVISACSNEWKFSNWQTYTGAAVGGAIGGVTTLYAGPVIGVAVGAGSSTLIGQTLENVTSGGKKRTAGEVLLNTGVDTIVGGVTAKLLPVKASGFTAGRNNMDAVFKSGLTKLSNQTANTMSIKVMTKGFVSGMVGGLGVSAAFGVKNFTIDSFESLNHKSNTGQPYGPMYWTAR